jgi:hypothetical protein
MSASPNNQAKPNLCFYTCFFGPDGNVANQVPTAPSKEYPCFYFTNNPGTLAKLQGTGWKGVDLTRIPIKSTDRENAMDAKELKAAPHHFAELKPFAFTCYMDSKLAVKDTDVVGMCEMLQSPEAKGAAFMIGHHPFCPLSVWGEFDMAMGQPRYKEEEAKMRAYIAKQLAAGLKAEKEVHHQTGFIVRRSCPEVEALNEGWWADIKECGIECQVSIFFVHQRFRPVFLSIPSYGSSY